LVLSLVWLRFARGLALVLRLRGLLASGRTSLLGLVGLLALFILRALALSWGLSLSVSLGL
jgi:hypothetical protein